MSVLDNLFTAVRRAPGVAGDAVEALTRDADPDSGAPGPAQTAETLSSIDARLRPIVREIKSVDESAGLLRAELETSRGEIKELTATAKSLNETMARLSGDLEHLLDRVPGLSPERARERAEDINDQ